ncbi:MAG: hypothetical protein IH943_06915 [Acidobacteria bacterium]|nr:hypothetical protein [Acidobacteriota bacterium]
MLTEIPRNGATDNPEEATARRRMVPWLRAAIILVAGAALIVSCGGDEALNEDDFVGMWVSNDGVYVQFNENGTLTVSGSPDGNAEGNVERGQWNLDGSEFTWAGDEDSPSCAGQASRYTVEPAGNGAVKWTAIGGDPCPGRASDLRTGPMRPYNP